VPLDETIGALCDAQRRGLTVYRRNRIFPWRCSIVQWRCRHRRWSRTSGEYHPYLDQTKAARCLFRHGMALISHCAAWQRQAAGRPGYRGDCSSASQEARADHPALADPANQGRGDFRGRSVPVI